MIKAVGTDIAKNSRFDNLNEGVLRKIFTQSELDEAGRRSDASAFFSSRFAAKEAFVKALGKGFKAIKANMIEIRENEDGMPYIVTLSDVLNRDERVFLSISHEEEYSVAMVVIDGKE
ncbi:MAG TPA: holo-ACP synthase [Candidatus Ornithospirochaeta avicola]|uniref:Holo-[acyl-carrier-protein] synthase n=1 Tax=Candidatus Ornithospirochaeta avicola TaxID=2840896 RepID=A0A9D1TNL0_9SPIO|nr:holo-ACP synthase [Candidatus Ornithospirochaeta avicola]